MTMQLNGAGKVDLIRSFSNLSIHQIVEQRYPSISKLSQQYGIEKTEKVVQVLVLDLASAFDSELGDDQVAEISAELTSGLNRSMSMEDIYLICREIKTSSSFGKLTVNKVLTAARKHLEAKTKAAADYSLNKHLSNKHIDRTRLEDEQQYKDELHKVNLEHYTSNMEKKSKF